MKRVTTLFNTTPSRSLIIALCWQVFFLILGWVLTPQSGVLGHMSQWDSGWYQHIIQYAYSTEGSPAAPAFYPLFPLAIGALQIITLHAIPLLLLSLLTNIVALWLAIWALLGILNHFKVSRFAKIVAVAAFLSFPSAFFLHVFYSEAIFIALAFWAYYFALQRRWHYVGILLAILTACRLPSLLFVGLCGLEYLRSYRWDYRKALNKNILWFAIAPLGFIAYGLYLLIVRGDFLAMFHAYDMTNDWTYQVFSLNIFSTLADSISTVVSSLLNKSFNYEIFINNALPLLAIALLLAASIYLLLILKSKGIPLFLFGLFSVILFTLNSNIVSVHRYTLACIVIFIAVALFAQRHAHPLWKLVLTIIIVLSICLQVFLYVKFINGVFAG